MTIFDYFIIATLGISAVISLSRGFFKEVISLGSWLIAVWAAFTFAEKLAPKIVTLIPVENLALGESVIIQTLVSGALIFFAILMLGALVNYIFSVAVQKTGLTGSDRFLGMIFGAARGALIVAIVTMVISKSSLVQKEQWWQASKLKPHALRAANIVQAITPEKFKAYLPGGFNPAVTPVTENIMPVDSSEVLIGSEEQSELTELVDNPQEKPPESERLSP